MIKSMAAALLFKTRFYLVVTTEVVLKKIFISW